MGFFPPLSELSYFSQMPAGWWY